MSGDAEVAHGTKRDRADRLVRRSRVVGVGVARDAAVPRARRRAGCGGSIGRESGPLLAAGFAGESLGCCARVSKRR